MPVEVTDDWYAQDSTGNIWYLGEDDGQVRERQIVDRAGSFEAGVDGAEAGSRDARRPGAGDRATARSTTPGEAEDQGAVITVGEEQVEVPFGFFDEDVLMTRDLEPDRAAEPGAEVLRARRRPGAQRAHRRRRRTGRARQLHARWLEIGRGIRRNVAGY